MKPAKNRIVILGIDPSISRTGCSICHYLPDKKVLQVAQHFMIEASTIAKKENKQDQKIYGNIISLFAYEREITRVMDEYQPQFVASEDAFYNPKFPNAYLSLKLCINSIQRVLYNYGKILYKIAPKSAKQAVSTGIADKMAVQEAIQHLPDLIVKNTKTDPVDKLTEHEADSIAIAYAFTKIYLPDLMIQDS